MAGSSSAWSLATAAATASGVRIEPVTDLDGAAGVAAVAAAVWGEQSLTKDLVRALEHAGGLVFAARDDAGSMVGFVLGFAGFDDGLHVHSHMLAVMPSARGGGVGYALKLAQRAGCLDHGIGDVRWTFDPLVARNARFNLVKLGAVATRFLPGFYGEMVDLLNRGDRSDRFEVRWRLTSERVEAALRGRAAEPRAGPVLLRRQGDDEAARPVATGEESAPGARVEIPRDHLSLRRRDPGLGAAWRDASAEAFSACLAQGLEATWFTRDGAYVFTERSSG